MEVHRVYETRMYECNSFLFFACANSVIKINRVNVPNTDALLIATGSFVMHACFSGLGRMIALFVFSFWAMFYDLLRGNTISQR
jgi:hypothetical protein